MFARYRLPGQGVGAERPSQGSDAEESGLQDGAESLKRLGLLF